MVCIAKGIALLCLVTLSVSAQVNEYGQTVDKKIKIGESRSVQVNYLADVATPIMYSSANYEGPYDPYDPKGIIAAQHRRAKLSGEKTAQIIKSYVPPGIDTVAKKEAKSLLLSEGRRFAFTHPKETADLVGIALKAKNLVQAASNRVKKMEAHEGKGHH